MTKEEIKKQIAVKEAELNGGLPDEAFAPFNFGALLNSISQPPKTEIEKAALRMELAGLYEQLHSK